MAASDAALARIAAGASSLAERLAGTAHLPSPTEASLREAGEVAARWRAVVGRVFGASLEKRLLWDGRRFEDVLPFLGDVSLREGEELPAWADTLRAILSARRGGPPSRPPDPSFPPIPFEEALAGALSVGRQRLGAALGFDPLTRLSPAAYGALERGLVLHLSKLAERVLYLEFDGARPFGAKVLGGSTSYLEFAGSVGIELFERYPVLARLLSRSVELWAETSAELILRLEADRGAIEERFDASCDTVVELTPHLSDAHRGARSVAALTFASGLSLVYKPKDLALDLAFQKLIDWIDACGGPTLASPRVLNRGTHGWVERVDHAPCRALEERRRGDRSGRGALRRGSSSSDEVRGGRAGGSTRAPISGSAPERGSARSSTEWRPSAASWARRDGWNGRSALPR